MSEDGSGQLDKVVVPDVDQESTSTPEADQSSTGNVQVVNDNKSQAESKPKKKKKRKNKVAHNFDTSKELDVPLVPPESVLMYSSKHATGSSSSLASPSTPRSPEDEAGRKAKGTIITDSYFTGADDKLVSRLASRFESHIQGERESASRDRYTRKDSEGSLRSLVDSRTRSNSTKTLDLEAEAPQAVPPVPELSIESALHSPDQKSSVPENDSQDVSNQAAAVELVAPVAELSAESALHSPDQASSVPAEKDSRMELNQATALALESPPVAHLPPKPADSTDQAGGSDEEESTHLEKEHESTELALEAGSALVTDTAERDAQDSPSRPEDTSDQAEGTHSEKENEGKEHDDSTTTMASSTDKLPEDTTKQAGEQEQETRHQPQSHPVLPPNPSQLSLSLNPIEHDADVESETEDNLIFGVCVVGFHHARGPEVEYWVGPEGDMSGVWPYLPFQSLPDGSHSHEENFSYFTLLYDEKTQTSVESSSVPADLSGVMTLFGISCNRQVKATELQHVTSDITRSTVQKSVVVVARKPIFGPIKDKLAVVTRAYFIQGDFEDRRIIDNLYENLTQLFRHRLDEAELTVGMPLRELVYRLRTKVLVVLKALLLEKRVLFFASDTELLCASQFSIVSLIPNLFLNLDDSGSPWLYRYEGKVKKPTSLRTSDRTSLLAFMGLPLQLFSEGGIFNPYVPLQQWDELKSEATKYFLVGSTNSLLLSRKAELADVVVNMDADTVEIMDPSLNGPLNLSREDRRWMDQIAHTVISSWDPNDPARPKDMGFQGSEDYVRIQFEDYIMSLLACVKYDAFLVKNQRQPTAPFPRDIRGNPLKLYNLAWVAEWKKSHNYRIFDRSTDGELFDIVEPKHMCNSTLQTMDIPKQINSARSVADFRVETKPETRAQVISKSVNRAWSSLWEKRAAQKTGEPRSRSQSASGASQSAAGASPEEQGQNAGESHSSKVSVTSAASVATDASTATDGSSSTQDKETYLQGWSRWAATRRRQLSATRAPSL